MPLFALVGKSRTAFAMNGIELCVKDTDLVVKADKTLTLFMVNTLADNARKFTGRGGRVVIEAADRGNLVEVSVKDNGCGIAEDKLGHIFPGAGAVSPSCCPRASCASCAFWPPSCRPPLPVSGQSATTPVGQVRGLGQSCLWLPHLPTAHTFQTSGATTQWPLATQTLA